MRCPPLPRRPVLVRLAPVGGGTVCRVRALGSCPGATVEIAEVPDNPGLPLPAVFDVLADVLSLAWFPCGHEPAWVEHRPQQALADLLLRGVTTMARARVRRTAAGPVREPLSLASFRALTGS